MDKLASSQEQDGLGLYHYNREKVSNRTRTAHLRTSLVALTMSSASPGRPAGTAIVGICSLRSDWFLSSLPPAVISDGKTPGAMQLTRTLAFLTVDVNSKAIKDVK